MDPDPSEKSNEIPVNNNSGSNSRLRNDSECSGTSDDASGAKRFCPPSAQFVVPGLNFASPPKFVTVDEIMQAAKDIRDMALVHKIVVDQDFQLKPMEPPPDSLNKIVKETMEQAFWDILRTELAEKPPNFTQALILLEDIKKGLFSLLLPQHTKIKQQIGEVLDTELITQQAEAGVLDFPHYAQYIISVMAKLCAPIRDDKIHELAQQTDVVDTFKGILQTLDLMSFDMANITIAMAKPDIIAHSIEYERAKFAEILSVKQGDGLEHTRKWLLRHLNTTEPIGPDRLTQVRNATTIALANAYTELLEWNPDTDYPETFFIDEPRLKDLKERTNKVILTATIILVTVSSVGPNLQGNAAFKDSLKQHLIDLLPSENINQNLSETLASVAEQIIQDVQNHLKQCNLSPISEEVEQLLRGQILEVGQSEHRIASLIRTRLRDFFTQIIMSPTTAPQQVPAGLSALQVELAGITGVFLRLVSHNRAVFSQYYIDIVDSAFPATPPVITTTATA